MSANLNSGNEAAVDSIWQRIHKVPLVVQIAIGLVLGVIVAKISPETAISFTVLGDFFVSALKAVAPVLVCILVAAAIASHKPGHDSRVKGVLFLYLVGTLGAALIGVIASFLFPISINLNVSGAQGTPPQDVLLVIQNLILSAVSNPAKALLEANYIGLLAWGVLIGVALRRANESTRVLLTDVSHAFSQVVHWIIRLAPIGIFGLVATTVATSGNEMFEEYGTLLLVLVGSMLAVALIINPLIVAFYTKRNPYPLILTCLRESGLTAFFTRSSAANIPVNMALCERLKLDEETYSVSIPLGATINMAGAAITISVMALAAANSTGVQVGFGTALLLAVVCALGACGASGVAGGSLLLIPLATGILGLPVEVGMKMVAVGFVIGVVQDSVETALNSSTDVVFTAAALARGNTQPLVPEKISEV